MYSSERHEIPEFLMEQVVYYDYLYRRHRSKSWLVLTRNLKFYVFQRKQLIRSIDLKDTILRKVSQRLLDYQGPQNRWFKSQRQGHGDGDATASTSTLQTDTSALLNDSKWQQQDTLLSEISIGKYVYIGFGKTITKYFLLHCWDKLLVLEKAPSVTNEAIFKVTAQWEQVAGYKLVHDKFKFHAAVEITFVNGTKLRTNFNESTQAAAPTKESGTASGAGPSTSSAAASSSSSTNKEFKALFERVRSAKTELQLHKATTQKEFDQLRDTQAFGRDMLRSLKLEEKQMLSRCGDIWMRFVAAADALIIGVPLVNNCTAPNLTILRNLRAIFKFNTDALVRGVTYEQRIYKLQQRFENLETLETFFQCVADEDEDDEQLRRRTATWTYGSRQEEQQLLPESFAVLVLKMPISQIIAIEEFRNPLFLLFEVEKEMDVGTGAKTKIYQHQIFLQNLDFADVLLQRQAYEVNFSTRTLHQDFLAIACACAETKFLIKFLGASDLVKFEQLLVTKFDCEMLKRGDDDDNNDNTGNGNSSDNSMQKDVVDNENASPNSAQFFKHSVFYNRKPSSLWHGLVVLRVASAPSTTPLDDYDDFISTQWKFYTPMAERTLLLVKLLYQDLILFKCKVMHDISIYSASHSTTTADKDNVQVLKLENAMRIELSALLHLVNENSNKTESHKIKYEHLAKLQMQTDLFAVALP